MGAGFGAGGAGGVTEALADTDTPFLPRGVRLRWCPVRAAWFLLGPERALKLDASGAAILKALDGRRSLEDVARALAATFAAPPERIATDARKFLTALINRRLVEVRCLTTA
ncbi:MAG: pyrroloquinoline quinone biosynthesis peptide chaperone PqqD [Rhodobacterales bacterium CG18_big_fil_WC_8_21_14_2_50_71_9]|nr:MAG: pyrroloquinoline quinone biosynthesis peptide chaperone PqqD [Rhodobacterales bacterium CG18_big_fil_WC_8_21_14_2_50_71_9]PIY73252.1 MAG: pyrroloquinoline quinone biosynthesis peptide chaperone PqqD [Rhodobacterales bacterium CG_4_10_14_0_8_um_filter_70_9]PJA59003.1 MAG: pyrroloquinoline quinone biosynthesis peptide chaperone PqqD [Rhodobacterales bacterium CG_4_9_14_3_um_filter_71_31]